jgi:hypothetical protein
MKAISRVEEHSVSKLNHLAESEHELRWRLWREKCRRSDRVAESRMKIVFWSAVAILGAVILYCWLHPKALPERTQPTAAEFSSSSAGNRPSPQPFVTPRSERLRCLRNARAGSRSSTARAITARSVSRIALFIAAPCSTSYLVNRNW